MWILQGTCYNPGHDWKDGYTRGETVFAYSRTLRSPYAPGQHPRVGNIIAAVTGEHFRFRRVGLLTAIRLLPTVLRDLRQRRDYRRIDRALALDTKGQGDGD